jgi:SAM-dependent methyltransferase
VIGAGGVKMDRSEWEGSAGDAWAAEWRRTDRSFTAVTERLLARTRGLTFNHVLDIGCGAGELSLAIARGRPAVQVVGVDVSPQLVSAARARATNHPQVSLDLADAARWTAPAGFAPELLVSRHGVMFFNDPVAAFTHLAAIAAPQAQLVFSCFRAMDQNPVFNEIVRLLPGSPVPDDADAPGPFGFARRERIHEVLSASGWEHVSIDAFDFPMVVGAGENPVADAVDYFRTIGPAARAAVAMDEVARTAFLADVEVMARRHCSDGLVAMKAAGWIVSARKGVQQG